VKKLLLILFIALAFLLSVIFIRTLLFKSKQVKANPVEIKIDEKNITEHLSRAIQFETVSYSEPEKNKKGEFSALIKYLEKAYPKVHSGLKREIVNSFSLLYTWEGTGSGKDPALLYAHMDVVPVDEKDLGNWKYPPFSGKIADGFIWGRGSLDDKVRVTGILDAVENLLMQNFKPSRTIYIALGNDEEIGGREGAAKIAELLKSRGVSLDFELDEGMEILKGVMSGVSSDVALVGIAEKRYLSIELQAETEGGHSSLPARRTSIGILGEAVSNLEKNQMPAKLDGPARQMFEYIGPEMSFGKRLLFANLWLTEGLLKSKLEKTPSTNAMIRTTTAPTIIEAGVKDNIIPNKARAIINFRISPGDTVDSVVSHVKKVVNDPRITVNVMGKPKMSPIKVSAINSDAYKLIEKTVREVFTNTIVAPSLLMGATDSRHFIDMSKNVYRFAPNVLENEDIKRIHGINERVSVQNYANIVRFYIQFMKNI
jgi:carboxypeptidase PM20D1